MREKELVGFLEFFTETGAEGGYWAFHVGRKNKKTVTWMVCSKCFSILAGKGTSKISGIKMMPAGKISIRFPEDCPPDKHDFQPVAVPTRSHRELRVLKDGDRLTVYHPKNKHKIIWSGAISLRHYPVFQESAFGLWIHSDQNGVPRKKWAKWFFKEYPAELIPISKSRLVIEDEK